MPPTRSITLDTFVGRLWAWRWAFVAAAVAGAAVGFGVTASRSPVYEATATLLVRQGGETPAAVATSSMRPIIANHAVAAVVTGELQLAYSPSQFLASHVNVEEIPGTYLIRVRVRMPDGEGAARAANLIVREAVALNATFNRRGADALQGALQDELATARKRMNEAEQRFAEFRRGARAGAEAARLHEAEITEARLHAEYDLATRLYEEVAVQFGKLRLQVAEQSAELLVVEGAFAPDRPLSAGRLVAALFGAVSAFAAAVLVVAFVSLVSSVRGERELA